MDSFFFGISSKYSFRSHFLRNSATFFFLIRYSELGIPCHSTNFFRYWSHNFFQSTPENSYKNFSSEFLGNSFGNFLGNFSANKLSWGFSMKVTEPNLKRTVTWETCLSHMFTRFFLSWDRFHQTEKKHNFWIHSLKNNKIEFFRMQTLQIWLCFHMKQKYVV